MSFTALLSTYIGLNVAIIIGYAALALYKKLAGNEASARTELSLHYAALTFVALVVAAQPLLPKKEFFTPPAKVWTAASAQDLANPNQETAGYIALATQVEKPTVAIDDVALTTLVLAAIIASLGAARIILDLARLLKLRRKSYLIKKHKTVSILANDDIAVPFSVWLPGRNDVVVPSDSLHDAMKLRTIIAHELQHHRQRDTRWVYAMWALRVLCAPNPVVHLWNRRLTEIQEFACDETLVDREKVESREYARCLVEVAETARNRKRIPVCATGLLFLADRKLLIRRIEKMSNPSRKMRIGLSRIAAASVAVVMTGVAFASQGLVQDRRITMSDARRMQAVANQRTEFPVVLNEAVLKQLNRFIGTPDGREFMRNALRRMENHRPVIQAKIAEYGVPIELMAIPIAESGYKNMREGESSPTVHSAGLWQFIRSTARRYGLRVDATRDERLDVPLATDAALRYLESNRLLLRDWHLAVLGYNMGENAVRKAMDETGAKDAWTLIRLGHEGDKDYLAKVMAAVLIMKNPESVQ